MVMEIRCISIRKVSEWLCTSEYVTPLGGWPLVATSKRLIICITSRSRNF